MMTKKFRYMLITSFALVFPLAVVGSTNESTYDPFRQYNRAMGFLIGWGGTSVVTGIPMLFNDDPWVKRIGTQNLLWGGINIGVGTLAYASHKDDHKNMPRTEKIDSFRKAMVINGLLDVVYITTGVLLARFSGNDQWKATGVGFIIQGSFLLGFDWANYGLTFR